MLEIKKNLKHTQASIKAGYTLAVTSYSKCLNVMFALSIALFSTQASAGLKLSTLSSGWKSEAGLIVPTILIIIAAFGIIAAATGAISAVFAKKRNEPLTWQIWAVAGGAACIIIPTLILATAGTIGSGQGNAQGIMNDLNIR